MSKKIVAMVALGALTLVVGSACGSSSDSGFPSDGTDGGGSSSGTSGTSGGASGNLGTSSSSGASGTSGELGACGATTQTAQQLPVDILVMLDASGSMMEKTGAGGNGPTKWASVKTALNGFFADPKSAGLGVGLQIFPIEHPGTPASCASNAECTVGAVSLGRCLLKACHPATATSPIVSCDTAADCAGGAACYPLGVCSGILGGNNCLVGDPTYGVCGIGGGSCKALTTSTCEGSECVAADYSPAKVPIASLPGNAGALTGAINGTPNPPPNALTPTSVAMTSGIALAKAHAVANPTHTVVLVLATDGFPTRCAPLDIPGIAAIAAGGVSGTPKVKTFVIGVFTDADKATATANLDALAAGGGTSKALIVTTGGNVAADFQKALDTIRGSTLPCEYAIPPSEAGQQDFDKVNVQHTDGAGKQDLLGYKANAAACGTGPGWYYDVDPATGGVPTKIILCGATCDGVKVESGAAKVEILLGCKSLVK
jgi:hypothetical protein